MRDLKMFLKIEKFKKNEEGAALILTILIVGVLFILSSFLVNKVLVNTKIIEKAKEEEESYAIAKEGIVYAVEQLNTSDQATDWPGNPNWNNYNLDNKVNTGDESGNDVRMKVEKDTPPGYITIKSTDLPKKLVTLQGIADYKSPLTKYVRFINSDTTFGDKTFGGSGTLIEGRAPFCILGDLTWESGSSNHLILTGDDKAVVYGKITSFDETHTTLNINNSPPDSGHHYYTDPTDPSDPKLFDTAVGRYFDLAHLPSSYDYSSGSPAFHYGEPKSIFWPRIINEENGETINDNRYKSLAQANGIYIGGSPSDESSHWYTIPDTGWNKDGLSTTNSYTYTGTGTLVVLDGNGQTSGTAGQIGIDDGTGGATAGNDIIESSEWRPYPSNGVIYSPGNLRVCGVIGDDGTVTGTVYDHSLTIASGGTIYIESNVFKGTNNSSLSLLAKEYVTLNTTHRFVKGVDLHDFLFGSWSSPYENILGEEDHNQLTYSQFFAGGGTAVLDLKHQVTATEIDLNNVDFGSVSLIGADFMYVYGSNNASPDTSSDQLFGFLYDFNFLDLSESTHYEKIRCFQDTYAPSGSDPENFFIG